MDCVRRGCVGSAGTRAPAQKKKKKKKNLFLRRLIDPHLLLNESKGEKERRKKNVGLSARGL